MIDEIKDSVVADYLHKSQQTPVDVTRSILVFGKNSATYKFALSKTLLEMAPVSEASYAEIGENFLRHLVEHHKICPHQNKRDGTDLSKAMDKYVANNLSWNEVFGVAEKSIYNNVFDAFHNIGGGSIDKRCSLFEHDKLRKKIVLTDNLNLLQSNDTVKADLLSESEARWRVVEEAWRGNLSPLMLLDEREKLFFTTVGDHRINLRSAVPTLMPYQFGACFYCGCALKESVSSHDDEFPDVDHVLPISLLVKEFPTEALNPNGVWNLVLACRRCNRGTDGKGGSIPHAIYFERLLARNIYFTKEHKHAMKYSVLKSLGARNHVDVKQRMQEIYKPFSFFYKWSPRLS